MYNIVTIQPTLYSIHTGDITRGTLNKVLPYGDSIDVVELRGDHLLEALEHSVFDLDEDATNYQMMQLSGWLVGWFNGLNTWNLFHVAPKENHVEFSSTNVLNLCRRDYIRPNPKNRYLTDYVMRIAGVLNSRILYD